MAVGFPDWTPSNRAERAQRPGTRRLQTGTPLRPGSQAAAAVAIPAHATWRSAVRAREREVTGQDPTAAPVLFRVFSSPADVAQAPAPSGSPRAVRPPR